MYKARQGFGKAERLKGRALFSRLFKEGKYFRSGDFSLRLAHNNIKISRFGISIKKDIFPEAVQRNRVKRLIRETVRKNKQNIIKGYDILIRPKKFELYGLKYGEIEKRVLGLIKEAGILRQE